MNYKDWLIIIIAWVLVSLPLAVPAYIVGGIMKEQFLNTYHCNL